MSDKFSIELTRDGTQPNISFDGRLLYSTTSTPEKRVDSLPQASQALYIVLSPLLFHGVDYLKDYIPSDSRIIAVEFDENLFEYTFNLFKNQNKNNLADVDYLLTDSVNNEYLESIFVKYRLRKIIPVKLNHGYMISRKQYDSFIQQCISTLESFWKNMITTIHMGRLWCRNIIDNIPAMPEANDISSLKTEKIVIVAGAGESLEASIPVLKNYRESFYLIAADTAANSLISNGLTPDLLVAVESQHANLYDFYNSDSLKVPVAFDLTSSPELVRKHSGKAYFFISRFYPSVIFSILESHGFLPTVIPPLGSVGIVCLYLALGITSKNVFFTGLDFSFIPEKYHVRGAPSHILNMLNELRTSRPGFYSRAYGNGRFPASDKAGRRVYTDLIMKSYSKTLNELELSSNRLLDIAPVGLSSIQNFISEEELSKIFENCEQKKSKSLKQDGELDFSIWAAGSAEKLLADEEKKLSRAIESVVNFRNNSGSLTADELLKLISSIDYTWLFFPDQNPLPSLEPGFLKRFLFSAAFFRNKILKLLSGF